VTHIVTVGEARLANPSKMPSGSDEIKFNDRSLRAKTQQPFTTLLYDSQCGAESQKTGTHTKTTLALNPRNTPLGSDVSSLDCRTSCCKFGVPSNSPSGSPFTPLAVISRYCSLVLFSKRRCGRYGTPVVYHLASFSPFSRLGTDTFVKTHAVVARR
jgi:hypothetical protein